MYIKDLSCISPQESFTGAFFEQEPISSEGHGLQAIEPTYEGLPNSLLRRMGRSIRMAMGTGLPLLQKWEPDGIIIGTSDAGMDDCHKFLHQLMVYNEGTLTPTGFVQGAPSSLAGMLSLMAKNSGYNNTHCNLGLSFEGCLQDAELLFSDNAAQQLLIGAVEEICESRSKMASLAADKRKGVGHLKHGEGSAMFVVSEGKENAIARIQDVMGISCPDPKALRGYVEEFLASNGSTTSSIDILFSGDDAISAQALEPIASTAVHMDHKQLFGDSASVSAFALWLGTELIQGKKMNWMTTPDMPKNILIFNNFQDCQYGMVLLTAV